MQNYNLKFKIIKTFTFLLVFLTFTFCLLTFPVHAATPSPGPVDIGERFGFGNIGSLGEGTSRLALPVFEITAAMVIIYFLMGAFFFLKAGGNKEEIERAKNMMNHAIIGFIILMLAFLMIQFLLSSLFGYSGFSLF